MQPFVSVVIPVWNEETYIRSTVKSVLDQPCRDLEILIVNDGSTDRTEAVCMELQAGDERISYLYQENAGVSAARNRGIQAAHGKYIAFLDSDDQWVQNAYTEEVKAEIAREGCDIAAFGYCVSNESIEDVYQTIFPDDPAGSQGDKALDALFTAHSSNFYGKSLLDETGILYPPGIKFLEDQIFLNQIVYKAKHAYRVKSKTPLFIYRSNPHSVCHTMKWVETVHGMLNAYETIQRFLEEEYRKNGDPVPHYNAQQAMLYVRALRNYCFIHRSYRQWSEQFMANGTIKTIVDEIACGLSMPAASKKEILRIAQNPRAYYYQTRLYLIYRDFRRRIYRLFSLKILKR